ncbi:MAG TPA: hypothetical protein VFC90_01170 [Planctomycetota bacterium]|nr:hypothetical protein [Planctomycetota bacterium]
MRRTKSPGGLAALLVLSVAAIGAVVLLVALIDSGEAPPPLPTRLDPADTYPLIRIEDKVITRFHLKLGEQYQKLRAGKAGYALPDYGILLDYMRVAVNEEILRRHNRSITPQEIADERKRQESTSRDKAGLRNVVELLDQYPGMYEAIMVRPYLANEAVLRLHQDRALHREVYEKAERGMKEALANPDFFRRMKEEDPQSVQRVDSRDPMPGPPDQQHAPQAIEKFKKDIVDFVNKHLGGQKPGDIHPELVDDHGAYMILRLVERSADHVVYEKISYRKGDYGTWFEGELRKLKGEVVDPETRALLKDKLKDHVYGSWLFPMQ